MKKSFLCLLVCTSSNATDHLEKNPTIQHILNSFKDYSTNNPSHAGNLYEHSIWVANTIALWWDKSSFWVSGINESEKITTIIAGLLHDTGYAGDLVYFYRQKKDHAEVGFDYATNRRPYLLNASGQKIDFPSLFQALGLDSRQQALVAILTGIHLDFFEKVIQPFSEDQQQDLFKTYLDSLQTLARTTDYGTIDDQLVRMAILIGAADVHGFNPVNYCGNTLCFAKAPAAHPTKKNSYQQYAFDTKGKQIRANLLDYFKNNYAPEQLALNGFPIPLKEYAPGQIRTQTEALLGFPHIQNLAMELYGSEIHRYKNNIKKMIQKEHDLLQSHYVFYHGLATQWYVLHDIIYEFYKHFYPLNSRNKSFYTLRLPRAQLFDTPKTVNDFLDQQIINYSEVHDTPSIKNENFISKNITNPIDWTTPTKLLSVNLSLFGNIGKETLSECSFNYFAHNLAHTGIDITNVLRAIIQEFPLPTDKIDSYVATLAELSTIIQSREGAIYQIFIPKKDVDEYVYLARNFGAPSGSPLTMNYLFNRTMTREQRLQAFWMLVEKNPKLALETSSGKISTILEQYRHAPETIPNINRLQARIIFTNDMMLSPASGVKIMRYTTVPERIMKKYKKALKEVTQKIFKEALAEQAKKSIPEHLGLAPEKRAGFIQYIDKEIIPLLLHPRGYHLNIDQLVNELQSDWNAQGTHEQLRQELVHYLQEKLTPILRQDPRNIHEHLKDFFME